MGPSAIAIGALLFLTPAFITFVVAPPAWLALGRRTIGLTGRLRIAVAAVIWISLVIAAFAVPNAYVNGIALSICFAADATLAGWFALRRKRGRARVVLGAGYAMALVVAGVIVLAYARPVLEYEDALARCGHSPVLARTEAFLGGADVYWVSGDDGYTPMLFGNTYFCSASEAEAAGYTRGG